MRPAGHLAELRALGFSFNRARRSVLQGIRLPRCGL